MAEQIFHDHPSDAGARAKWYAGRVAIYGVLILWTVICLFPIYWTVTTSFKLAPDVMRLLCSRGSQVFQLLNSKIAANWIKLVPQMNQFNKICVHCDHSCSGFVHGMQPNVYRSSVT